MGSGRGLLAPVARACAGKDCRMRDSKKGMPGPFSPASPERGPFEHVSSSVPRSSKLSGPSCSFTPTRVPTHSLAPPREDLANGPLRLFHSSGLCNARAEGRVSGDPPAETSYARARRGG